MFEPIIQLIDEALRLFPVDILSHVTSEEPTLDEGQAFSFGRLRFDTKADAEGLGKWIRERLSLVLAAMARDKAATKVLVSLIRKNVTVPSNDFGPRFSAAERRIQRRITEEQAKALALWLDDKETESPPAFPVGIQRKLDDANKGMEKAMADFEAAFLSQPVGWLWALWRWWPEVTGQASPGPVPDLFGKTRGGKGRQRFVRLFREWLSIIGARMKMEPGVAANQLKRALEDVKAGLASGGKKPGDAQDAAVRKSILQRVWSFIKEVWVLTVEGMFNSLTKHN